MKLSELLAYNEIVIQCHDSPDADSIASGYGVFCYLKKNGKNPRLVYGGDRKVTKTNLLLMIKLLEIPLEHIAELKKPELLITVDCVPAESNVSKFDALRYAAIDHHQSVKNLPEMSEIRSNYGSCATIVAKLLEKEGYPLAEDIKLSTALYYGLYSDTANLSEIIHPADKDLRDFARTDSSIITLLANSVLSLPEIRIAGNALDKIMFNDKMRYAVAVAEPCDPNILGYINDLVLQVDNIDVSVVGCYVSRGFKVSVRSCITDVHADDMAYYITDGNGGGHKQKAGGLITSAISDPQEYLISRIDDYFASYDIIRAEEYTADISRMKKYRKMPETIGFARTTDIVPSGTDIRVRMIEADLDIRASESVYIMIGKKGNIYPIGRDKFEATYTPTGTPYEITADYDPKIITRDNPVIRVAPFARGCVSKKAGACIYAKKLNRMLKLFTSWDKSNYMLGRIGDYLAVRADDIRDMYIIPQEQFELIYRESEE